MLHLTVKDVLIFLGIDLCSVQKGILDVPVKSISVNSHKTESGSLFVPLRGKKTDGHLFISDAFSYGAVASLCEKSNKNVDLKNLINFPLIKVDDSLSALQKIGLCIRKKYVGKTVGITGSCGKTTTKDCVYAVLRSKFKVFKKNGNFNGQIGVPLTLFELDNTYDIAVIEMGISEFGEMDNLTKLVKPDIAVITNIGHSHLEYLKSVENVFKEKLKICNRFNENSVLIVNGDDAHLRKIKNLNFPFRIFTYGIHGKNLDFKAVNIKQDHKSTMFDIVHENKVHKGMRINTLGQHHVSDATAAIAVGSCLGISLAEVKSSLVSIKPEKGRQCFKKITLSNKADDKIRVTFIDDCYNANPESMMESLNVLEKLTNYKRKIAVISDMLEQGNFSENLHKNLGRLISEKKLNILITIGKYSFLTNETAKKYSKNLICYHTSSKDKIYMKLVNILKNGDVVLFKGSLDFKLEDIINRFEVASDSIL